MSLGAKPDGERPGWRTRPPGGGVGEQVEEEDGATSGHSPSSTACAAWFFPPACAHIFHNFSFSPAVFSFEISYFSRAITTGKKSTLNDHPPHRPTT